MSDAAELQRIARLIEMYRQQLSALGEQIERLNEAIIEHQEVIRALESLENNVSPKMMIPLGSGTQLLVDKMNNPSVVIDIGSGIQSERTVVEAVEILNKRISDIQELVTTLQSEFDETEAKVKNMATQFSADAEELQVEDESEPEVEEDSVPTEQKKSSQKRRRRNVSGELTLDD
jgi:prefoldin alpha subunit